MAGQNRFVARSGFSVMENAVSSTRGVACVFISHKYEDLPLAIKVGNLLKDLEIDIWLDAEDASTQQAIQTRDEKKLAEAIERGLSNSTHLLALISPKTKGSWWVPYEIGSVRGRSRDLAFFVHKDVADLPSYLIFGRRILDQHDFYRWAADVSSNRALTESRGRLQKSRNPLADVLPGFRLQ